MRKDIEGQGPKHSGRVKLPKSHVGRQLRLAHLKQMSRNAEDDRNFGVPCWWGTPKFTLRITNAFLRNAWELLRSYQERKSLSI